MTQHALPFGAMSVALLVTVVSIALWITLDAATRAGTRPWVWGLLTIPVYPVFPLSLYLLRRRHERVRSPGRRYVVARTVAVGSVVAFLVASVVAPPDPLSQLYYWLGTFPVAIAAVAVLDRYWPGDGDRVTL